MFSTKINIASFATLLIFIMSFVVSPVYAASLQNTSNDMSSQKINAPATHAITFDIHNALTAGDDIVLTFPSDFDFSGVTTGNITSSGATVALSGTENRIITLTYAAGLTAGATVTVNIAGVLALNPSTAQNYIIAIAADNGDTGEITVPILNDDEVVITARVNQVLNFDISHAALTFGDLTSANARYAIPTAGTATETVGHTLTAGTNAPGGYSIAVEGDTLRSLENSANTITTISGAVAAGTEQFGLKAVRTTGVNGAVDAKYNPNYAMTASATTPETLAVNTGATLDEVYDMTYVANIASLTEAGNYTTTMTYTMTANF